MRLKFVQAMFIIALWGWCGLGTMAQSTTYHRLSADEFEGKPGGMAGAIAYTNCSIDFHYRVTNDSRNNIIVTPDVQLVFNRDKSWIDKRRILNSAMMAAILKHEQGHYTIAYMEQQELLRTISKTRFTTNYQAQAAFIFDKIDAKYKQLTDNYDTDTQHSLDRVQQHSWDEYFKKRLAYMPPVAM